MSSTIDQAVSTNGHTGSDGDESASGASDERVAALAALEARLEQREARRDGWLLSTFVLAGCAIVSAARSLCPRESR
jgi:squalene cyclase